MELASLSERLQETADAHFYRAYVGNYYQNVYDYHKTVGLPQPPASLDAKRVESVLQTAWVGKNYSARIWTNRSKLAKEIQRSMLTAIHRGSSIQQLSKDLSQRMEVGYKNAERLIRTELNAVENKASADAMKDAEFTHYQFMATLDRRTCIRCGEKDGEIFALADMNQGENAPPLHPRCRCTIVATFDTPKSKGRKSGERAARETDRNRAPADMTYREWKAVYIDKTKPFDEWRAEKNAQYKAAEVKTKAEKIKQSEEKAKQQAFATGQTYKSPYREKVGGVTCKIEYSKESILSGSKIVDAKVYIVPDGTRFIFPDRLDTTKQSMTPDKAIELWRQIPPSVRKQSQKKVAFLDFENPQDYHWRKVYKNFTRSYATGGDEIVFYECTRHQDYYVKKTYCHEAGHFIDRQKANALGWYSERDEWSIAMSDDFQKSGLKSPTTYGENSPHEDFAESLAEYIYDKKKFNSLFAARAKLLREILK